MAVYFQIMEKHKSKIFKILNNISHRKQKNNWPTLNQTPYSFSFQSPKKTKPTIIIKSTKNLNGSSGKAHLSKIKSSMLNKTEQAVEKQKLEKTVNISINETKVKKVKSLKALVQTFKQPYRSTQDECISQQKLGVQICVGKTKLAHRYFFASQKILHIRDYLIQLLKLQKNVLGTNRAILGLDPIPYNHGVKSIMSKNESPIQELLDKNIIELRIQPILIKQEPSYENLKMRDFQLLKFLGSGGFSTVYLAKCEIDQQVCALKFIQKSSITSANKAKMLENEREILFTTESPYLVDLLYAFQTANFIVFGLEFCQNGSLYHLIKKHKQISQPDAKFIFKQVLNGLQYLHESNILFRDLKLENILINQQGQIKITDFGLSKPELAEEQITYSYCGSPEYMAPEMLMKSGHSFKVDYYALGVLLYELIYGRSPFYALSKQEIFTAVLNSKPRFPKQPPVSHQLKDLIKGLLQRNPQRRIGSLKGAKQIRSHPWVKNGKGQMGQIFKFPLSSLKISQKQLKDLQCLFKNEYTEQKYIKCFFPKSFVNKRLVDDMKKNCVILVDGKNKPRKNARAGPKPRMSHK